MPETTAHTATTSPPVILLAGDRFFVRRVPLVPGTPVDSQVELALETLAPFPLEQLFYGHVVDYKGQHALIYAAYRRNFSPAEQAAWETARAVLPEFIFWCAAARRSRAGTGSLRASATGLEAVAWDDASELPSQILSRRTEKETQGRLEQELLGEFTQRTGLNAEQINSFHGDIDGREWSKAGLSLALGDAATATIPTAILASADVRDKTLLAARQREQRRSSVLWRVFATVTVALAACLVLEGALFGGQALLAAKQRDLETRKPAIQQIESAQLLATRLEKMTAQQLRPFEMLAAVNQPRPASVEFLRVSTNGPLQLSIEAQTNEASDLRTYETALRSIPGIQQVELRDPRMRSGRTSFQLEVTFKPNWSNLGAGT